MSRLQTPLVSVITPVLNAESTIMGTLRCVAGQTYENIEHIVMDGGSTDSTIDIVSNFEERHPLRWFSGPDSGMYDAINKGFEVAGGEIICYLNADDFYFPWSVEAVVEAFAEGSDLLYGDMGVISKLGPGPKAFYIQFYPHFDLRYYTYSSPLGQPSVFWRREIFETLGGFDISYKLLGEVEYWLRCSRAGLTLSKVDEVLSVQVDHPGTLRATQGSAAYNREWQKLFDDYSPVAGSRPSDRRRLLKKSLWWRWYMSRFLIAAKRSNAQNWSRFLYWLRSIGVTVDTAGVLRYFGPGSTDRSGASWSDAEVIEQELNSY